MADIKINITVVEGQAIAAMKGLEQATKSADKSVDSLNLSFKGVSTSAIAVGNVIANYAVKAIDAFGSAVGHLVSGGLKLEAQIQNLTSQFQALLPVTKDAKEFLEEINKISDQSPFEFPELAETARTLLTFGVNSEKISETLKVLGDVATASGANIQGLALAFGKATESGIISGRELNEFRNNGIPIIQELAKELGVSTTAVKKLANEGKIDIKTFEAALVSMGQEGGFAFDAMTKRANTLDGAQKRLTDSVEVLQKLFGENLAPAVIAIKNALTLLIEQTSNYLKSTDLLEQAAMATVFGFNMMVDVFVTVYNSIQGLRYIVTLFGAGLIEGVVTPINLVLTGLESLIRGLSSAAGALGLNNQALTEAADSINVFRTTLNEVPSDIKKSADAIADDMTNTSITADKFKTSVEDAYISLSSNLKAAAKGTKTAADEINNGLTEAQKEAESKQLESRIKHSEAMLAEKNKALLAEQQLIFLQDGIVSEAEELALLEQQDRFARQLEMEKEQSLQRQIEQDIVNQVEKDKLTEHQNQLSIIQQTNQANQLARDLQYRQKQAEQQKKFNEGQKQLDTTLADQKVNIMKSSFGLAAALAKNGSKEQFLIQKAAALAEIAVARGKAIALIPAQTAHIPYPANAPAAAQLLANANIQAAIGAATVVASAIQGFESGGVVGGSSFSGDNVMARVNSGEMILNRQQQAQLFDIANGSGSGGQVIEVHNVIQLDGEVVGRSVSRQVANGLKLGEVV